MELVGGCVVELKRWGFAIYDLRLSILFEGLEKACVIREILLDGKVADVV